MKATASNKKKPQAAPKFYAVARIGYWRVIAIFPTLEAAERCAKYKPGTEVREVIRT